MKVAETKTSAAVQTAQASRQAEKPFFQHQSESERTPFFGQQAAEAPTFFQPKLKIGQPNDFFEHQADAVAEQVVKGNSELVSGDKTQAKGDNLQRVTNQSTNQRSAERGEKDLPALPY